MSGFETFFFFFWIVLGLIYFLVGTILFSEGKPRGGAIFLSGGSTLLFIASISLNNFTR